MEQFGMTNTKESTTLADALPAEIKRIQAKRERWLGYAKDAGPQAMFGPALTMMQMAIDEGVQALASGDVVRMLRAHAELKDYSDDD
jgi:hypothetical protein